MPSNIFESKRLMGLPEAIRGKDLKAARRQIKRIDWSGAANGPKNRAESSTFLSELAGVQKILIEGASAHEPKTMAFAQSLMIELRAQSNFEPYVRQCVLEQKTLGHAWLWELSVSVLKNSASEYSDDAKWIIREAATRCLAHWPLRWDLQRPEALPGMDGWSERADQRAFLDTWAGDAHGNSRRRPQDQHEGLAKDATESLGYALRLGMANANDITAKAEWLLSSPQCQGAETAAAFFALAQETAVGEFDSAKWDWWSVRMQRKIELDDSSALWRAAQENLRARREQRVLAQEFSVARAFAAPMSEPKQQMDPPLPSRRRL